MICSNFSHCVNQYWVAQHAVAVPAVYICCGVRLAAASDGDLTWGALLLLHVIDGHEVLSAQVRRWITLVLDVSKSWLIIFHGEALLSLPLNVKCCCLQSSCENFS